MSKVFWRAAFAVTLGLLAMSSPAHGSDFMLDLAGERKVTRSVSPQQLRFFLVNRLPKGSYTIAIEKKVIKVGDLGNLALPGAGVSSQACDDVVSAVEALPKAADEKQVKTQAQALRALVAGGKCTDSSKLALAEAALSLTISPVDEGNEPTTIGYGEVVTVIVTRGTETWEFAFDGGARGEWLTTYGVSIARLGGKPFFAKPAEGGKFTVTPQASAEEGALDVIPAAFYTWLPRQFANQNFSPGITGGVGITSNAPAFFVGGSLLYNWNLQLAFGVTVSKQSFLSRDYSDGQTLSEFLAPDKLNTGQFKSSLGIVLSFRFGGNPWKSDAAAKAASASETPKKEAAASSQTPKKGGGA
jgi:hypothetical protein